MVSQWPDEIIRKGPWLEEEDERLVMFVTLFGGQRWDTLARASGLKRSGKSCRLRWVNYLRPNLKHGPITEDEKSIILHLHALWGNKWSKIARRLPGRTDNEIKNYWRTYLRKKDQIQECGNFRNKRDDTRENFLCKNNEMETRIQQHGSEDRKKINHKNFAIDKKTSDDISEMRNIGVINSPFETRISHWISEISMDQIEANVVEKHCYSRSIGVNSSAWFQANRDLEEFSCSLWT